MPKILEDKANNLTVYIYTNDHEPAHVHIFKGRKTDTNKADVKIYIGSETEPPRLIEADPNFKNQDIVKAMNLVANNQELFLESGIKYMARQWKKEFNLEGLQEEIEQAKAAYQQAEATEPYAESVSYDQNENLIVIKLKNGARVSFPPNLAQGLENASPEQLADVWVSASGRSIHWDSLDADFSLANLVAGIFGTKAWMAEIGRRGGKVTSEAKQNAARENGKKGGRPKKNNQSQKHSQDR
ncbi:DUF2442 domain-containing protein [Gloeothece verrucosa]|uniref:DUF2442 domain-containing protein n=1 Tax=Gloeothece verrucosa (strain PCC 7822) TaxID=497965 RepID=E0UJS9_GLOV7|nr:DUF2442 domain-containing protein [Gloeothece verrucosa]ADN13440.1 hypothetical protein Cyan7822_1444 [Gloeothece verrucosa PCC 7822]